MNAQQLYETAFDQRCSGNYREAKAAFQLILREEPNHADAQWQLGLIAGFEGDFDESREILTRVVDANPEHICARYDLGMTFMMLGLDFEACAQFREILRQDPAHEKALQQITFCP